MQSGEHDSETALGGIHKAAQLLNCVEPLRTVGLEAAGDRLYLLHQLRRGEWAVAVRQHDLGFAIGAGVRSFLLTALTLGGLLGLLGTVALELVKRRSLRTHRDLP